MDIMTAVDAGTLGLPDPNVLAVASRLDRILLSYDTHTMPGHFYVSWSPSAKGKGARA